MQTLRKKTSPCKYRNDPAKFFGDGVTFKAKLIGILEVGEARGDRMCQEALQDLKIAIRAAGEHKQRITIHVTIDGLRLRDEKTGDSLYHHPVHKISFIAQDMTDSRAFGYIFGSPDSGHRFFGIKTDKAASQVVLAMRDLFQVVFELKKKEIELARQHIQSKSISEHSPVTFTIKTANLDVSSYIKPSSSEICANKANKTISPESVADLVDLEQELSSIQRGITQMERITPNETNLKNSLDTEDPFGDSFTNFPTYNLLPPPESNKSRHSKPLKPPEETLADPVPSISPPISTVPENNVWSNNTPSVLNFDGETQSANITSIETHSKSTEEMNILDSSSMAIKYIDAFTDLDPLGTGKNKPYVDKKYFFQDLKNPPKKVLKDLSGKDGIFAANFSISPSILNVEEKDEQKNNENLCDIDLKLFECPSNSLDNSGDASRQVYAIEKPSTVTTSFSKIDPVPILHDFASDPFENAKHDPFMENNVFSKTTSDPFEFNYSPKHSTVLPETKITLDSEIQKSVSVEEKVNTFNGPLQVNLPPESWNSHNNQKKLVHQTTDISSPTTISTARNRPSVFKQNTVDVISSISSKKMKPHIFSQKFSKRDSNSINMRRLQESDSLSENETAPEPPPRPDLTTHIEPPPLPPKKQFSDIVIRPSTRSTTNLQSNMRESPKYDFLATKSAKPQNDNAPPLPLPCRKVAKSDSSYPGPGRPAKKINDDDDYLAPISKSELPILLPPPQYKAGSKARQNRKAETSEINKSDTQEKTTELTESPIPENLISELAKKLNVPASKLSSMSAVEFIAVTAQITSLSDIIEISKKQSISSTPSESHESKSAVFKVNFDDKNQDTAFVAKFDDSFGEDPGFVANFENFNQNFDQPAASSSTDKYAAFREIIEQDINNSSYETETFETPIGSLTMTEDDINKLEEESKIRQKSPLKVPITKIDTKITEVISHAKDRYAALRDIIVEDLFDKPPQISPSPPLFVKNGATPKQESVTPTIPQLRESNDNSPDINIFPDSNSIEDEENVIEREVINVTSILSTKDDLEIDEYMNRAISNLSLDSRDHLSPIAMKTSPIAQSQNASTSPICLQRKSPLIHTSIDNIQKIKLNDIATSPIPVPKSPVQKLSVAKSPASKSPIQDNFKNTIDQKITDDSLIDGSSPEDSNIEKSNTEIIPECNNKSWACFEQHSDKIPPSVTPTIKTKSTTKDDGESPCSSDGKEEWKSAQEYSRRWPNGQTSSSSRDVSPWDEDGPEYHRRRYHPPEKAGAHGRNTRRMNSCDEEYGTVVTDDKQTKRRERRIKGPTNKSRENFESENWYHLNDHHSWSPPEEDDVERVRSFDRSSYERSTYGPPYEKRDHKGLPLYDRRDFKSYDKRKYHRDYIRPDYDFDIYRDNLPLDCKERRYYEDEYDRRRNKKEFTDDMFEASFDRESRDSRGSHKSGGKEYFYDRDKRSFDRESVESYESGRVRRSFGSGEIYGSLDSRGEYRERNLPPEKTRSWRKGMRTRPDEEYEIDSENDINRRIAGDTRSLQRPVSGSRQRRSSGSSPWDGEDLTPTSQSSKSWKRPSSASESERRLAENKRMLCNTLSGSDGEKDRRFKKKVRSRSEKEPENRPNYASLRYPRRRGEDYFDFDESPSQMAPRASELYFQTTEEDKTTTRTADPMDRQYFNSKREQYFKNLTPRSETRSMSDSIGKISYNYEKELMERKKLSPRETGPSYIGLNREKKLATFDEAPKATKHVRMEFEEFDDFENTPQSLASSKFNFEEEQGFESDFNSPPTSGKEFRFSNNFSEKEPQRTSLATHATAQQQTRKGFQFESDFTNAPATVSQSKLRFDDKVTVSNFERNSQMFEDDFGKTEFDFEDEDKWSELPKKNIKISKPCDNIKKSESVNIFSKKVDDPFEDDEFFKSNEEESGNNNNVSEKNSKDPFQWENNFAKFDNI